MALDSTLSLLRGLPGEPPDRIRSLVANALVSAVHLDAVGGDAGVTPVAVSAADYELSLYLPRTSDWVVPEIVARLSDDRWNPYEVLDSAGILVLSSAKTENGVIRLSGGSYSEVVLDVAGPEPVVTKSVWIERHADQIDSSMRHRNEAEWLAAANKFTTLFPRLESAVEGRHLFVFKTGFFPAYSVAELVLQRRLSGDQLAAVLCGLYEELRDVLYTRPPIEVRWPDRDRDYIHKIRRRHVSLMAATKDTDTPLADVVRASRIRVNGRLCPSLETLLSAVESDPLWRPVLWTSTKHSCHGDLILEDILLSAGPSREVKLIDPNPYNQHGLFDLAKTMLSLWIGYEFVYFDLFEVSIGRNGMGDELDVKITFHSPGSVADYEAAAAQFIEYARCRLAGFLHLPKALFDRLVRMAAALTALAIPSFHLIAHCRPDRALAFHVLGLLHASYALSGNEPS
ncbi:hypothetical protein [Amycolatopsis sp. BJA-103]|uniref:hypothetical protein n=1 Tax=Amycolatopsis sp. BJA-103 TaxID=1911175 RepID=UPI000C76AEBE|nr:hypothetical protein [Amycolatopsis sp. BJA-103]AUI60410.1 hypothetical protein BKN51_20905 [Amycolatopsis sp. BJA-103]PNE16433.1 hypothetical protein B1H26_24540 [Amycolatopsis sp. BJA-103]